MNLAIWLQRSAQLFQNQPAIALGEEVWCTYSEMATRAARAAAWYQAKGCFAGQRVALFMQNQAQYLELLWGAWWAGLVAVPINAKLHPKEVAWIIAHSQASLVLTDEAEQNSLQEALLEHNAKALVQTNFDFLQNSAMPCAPLQPMADAAPCWLFYTSGTTGRPKGVMLCPEQLRLMSLAFLSSIQTVSPGDHMLHPAPLSHGGGMYHLPYVLQGATNVIPKSGSFDADECLRLAAFWKNASFFAAPTMVRRLVEAVKTSGVKATGLQTIIYGGGPMYLADIQEALEIMGPHFAQIYGQGECPMTITVLPKKWITQCALENDDAHLASVGFAQNMVELSIQDDQGRILPTGQKGEICVKGRVVMAGYWQDPIATQKAIRNGWLATGDVGVLDPQGFLTLLDRSKDLVVSGGSNIYPREIEEVLLSHEAVAEVSVIGRPDPEWGEVVVAYVVLHDAFKTQVNANTLDLFCLDNIARFKRPKDYCFVDALPKNNYGKVLKTTLREWDKTYSKQPII